MYLFSKDLNAQFQNFKYILSGQLILKQQIPMDCYLAFNYIFLM